MRKNDLDGLGFGHDGQYVELRAATKQLERLGLELDPQRPQ